MGRVGKLDFSQQLQYHTISSWEGLKRRDENSSLLASISQLDKITCYQRTSKVRLANLEQRLQRSCAAPLTDTNYIKHLAFKGWTLKAGGRRPELVLSTGPLLHSSGLHDRIRTQHDYGSCSKITPDKSRKGHPRLFFRAIQSFFYDGTRPNHAAPNGSRFLSYSHHPIIACDW